MKKTLKDLHALFSKLWQQNGMSHISCSQNVCAVTILTGWPVPLQKEKMPNTKTLSLKVIVFFQSGVTPMLLTNIILLTWSRHGSAYKHFQCLWLKITVFLHNIDHTPTFGCASSVFQLCFKPFQVIIQLIFVGLKCHLGHGSWLWFWNCEAMYMHILVVEIKCEWFNQDMLLRPPFFYVWGHKDFFSPLQSVPLFLTAFVC